MKEYNKYFLSNEEIWYNTLAKIESYIHLNNKTPTQSDKDESIKNLVV